MPSSSIEFILNDELITLNDIDTNMVDSKSLFTNIENIKELDSWEVQQWSLCLVQILRSQKQEDYGKK